MTSRGSVDQQSPASDRGAVQSNCLRPTIRRPPSLLHVHVDRHTVPNRVFECLDIRSVANKFDDLLEVRRDLNIDPQSEPHRRGLNKPSASGTVGVVDSVLSSPALSRSPSPSSLSYFTNRRQPLPSPCSADRPKSPAASTLHHVVRHRRSEARRPLLLRPVIVQAGTRFGLFNAQSVGNKAAMVCDQIASERLQACAVVETWHYAPDCPNLIACTPPGYRYIEKARKRSSSYVGNLRTNHGGVCFFYISSLSVRQEQLSEYTTFEFLAVHISGSRRNALVLVVYRPGTAAATIKFF